MAHPIPTSQYFQDRLMQEVRCRKGLRTAVFFTKPEALTDSADTFLRFWTAFRQQLDVTAKYGPPAQPVQLQPWEEELAEAFNTAFQTFMDMDTPANADKVLYCSMIFVGGFQTSIRRARISDLGYDAQTCFHYLRHKAVGVKTPANLPANFPLNGRVFITIDVDKNVPDPSDQMEFESIPAEMAAPKRTGNAFLDAVMHATHSTVTKYASADTLRERMMQQAEHKAHTTSTQASAQPSTARRGIFGMADLQNQRLREVKRVQDTILDNVMWSSPTEGHGTAREWMEGNEKPHERWTDEQKAEFERKKAEKKNKKMEP